MVNVYGAAWCDDTRRSLRLLRRLGVPHRSFNVDEDIDALARATSLNGGRRRTPTIDLGVGGPPLVEPDNDALTGALIELEMLTEGHAQERLAVQNVGDMERVIRTATGAGLMLAAAARPRTGRWPLQLAGAIIAVSGLAGWCPVYHSTGVTSIDGPGDHPDETTRDAWLTRRPEAPDHPADGAEAAQ